MAVKQVIIVRRGCDDPYRSLQATFGVEPIDGGVLVLRETSVNGPCSVSTVPGPTHLLLPSYNEAVAYALRLAGRIPLDVWYTEDYLTFTAVRRANVHPMMSEGRRRAGCNVAVGRN